jgi:cytoskeletal protein RodZ
MNKNKSHLLRNIIMILSLVIVVIGAVFLYKTIWGSTKKSNTTIPSTSPHVNSKPSKGEPDKQTATTGNTDTSKTSSPATTSQTAELIAPYGSFVSNHNPGSTDQELSYCITTPGATCNIEFSSAGVTKKLTPQLVDGSGSTSWLWRVNDAGLSKGSWQISVTASLSGKTKTTVDKKTLDIK